MDNNTTIVCFAGCDWWYHNRGLFVPQVMSRIAKHKRVLFINSIGMRTPNIKDDKDALIKILRKLASVSKFLRKDKDSGMYIFSPLSVPLKSRLGKKVNHFFLRLQTNLVLRFLGISKPIYYIGSPPAWEIVKNKRYSYLIYERTDIFSEMPGVDKPYIEKLDNELMQSANLVLYVNTRMWEDGMKFNKNSLLIGHGVDYNLFSRAAESKFSPKDISDIPKPIIGFFGDITPETSDLSLLKYIATKLPNMSLVLVGPISTDISELKTLDNIFFLGPKPYDLIPHYGKYFDVSIMAWEKNRWIELCNPVKMKEYLALANPIVTTRYPEAEQYSQLIYIADDYDDFVNKVKIAVKEDNDLIRERRRQAVVNETWDHKVNEILEYIYSGHDDNCH